MKIEKEILDLGEKIENDLREQYKMVDLIREKNFLKVLNAFQEVNLDDSDFGYTAGYGYSDIGREKTEAIFAKVFGGADALVRPQIISGTHAINVTLFGLLRPGDLLLYASGAPYETAEGIIGFREAYGSLREFGIEYEEFDFREGINESLIKKAKVIALQRSKG
jgi:cystathionine beta-lyase family protein involved in aluminum resistance